MAAAAGGILFFPKGIWTTTAELLHDATGNIPITIVGTGAGSVLKLTGTTNKGIHITGTAGTTRANITLRDFKILSATSGTSAAGIHLDGIADYNISNVVIDGDNKMTNGMQLTGSQQGEIGGGLIIDTATGILFEPSGGTHSNGCDLHGVSLNASAINIDVNTVDSIFIRGNHMTGAPIGVDVHGDGLGVVSISHNHIEQQTTAGVRIRDLAQRVRVIANNFNSGTSGAFDMVVTGGDASLIFGNLFTGSISFDNTTTDAVFAANLLSAGGFANTFTDNTINADGSSGMTKWGNISVGFGADSGGARFNTNFGVNNLPTSSPGAGTKRLWYDTSDNTVKYAP
jgi:hypothetical protein